MQMLISRGIPRLPAAARESVVVSVPRHGSLDRPASSSSRSVNSRAVAAAAIDYAIFDDLGRWQASSDYCLWSLDGVDSSPVAATPDVSVTFGNALESASTAGMDAIELKATGLSSLAGGSACWMIPIRTGVDYRF